MTHKIQSFYPIVLLFVFSCSTVNSKGKNFYIKNFKDEFKQAAFCNCLLYGYNDKSLASRLTQIDKTFYNPIMQNIFSEELTEISINEYKLIKKDSLNSIQTISEANAGKRVLKHCLNFYESKKLDSITAIQYKKWKSIKNVDLLIEVKNPGF